MVESCRVVFFSFVEVQYLSEAIVCFTHWGRLTHICVGNLAIIGSDNGFSPYRRHAIICTNDGILLIGPLGTNFSGILIEIHIFLFRKLSSEKWRSFCLGLNVLSCGKSIASTSNHSMSLQWRHNGRDSVSNHQPHGCLLGRLFRRRSKKTSKLRATGLCAGNSPGTDKFPAQMASNAETVSIWRRRHVIIDPSTNLNRLTLYVLNFSEGKKHIFTFYVIPPHWHDRGSWNHFSNKTRTCLFYISISWVVMSWRRKEPCHHQPWYLLYWTELTRSAHVISHTRLRNIIPYPCPSMDK